MNAGNAVQSGNRNTWEREKKGEKGLSGQNSHASADEASVFLTEIPGGKKDSAVYSDIIYISNSYCLSSSVIPKKQSWIYTDGKGFCQQIRLNLHQKPRRFSENDFPFGRAGTSVSEYVFRGIILLEQMDRRDKRFWAAFQPGFAGDLFLGLFCAIGGNPARKCCSGSGRQVRKLIRILPQ